MTDSLKEAVERAHDTLEIVGHFLSGMTEVDPRADVLMLLNSVRASTRALSALKAAERPQPVPGREEIARVIDPLPFDESLGDGAVVFSCRRAEALDMADAIIALGAQSQEKAGC